MSPYSVDFVAEGFAKITRRIIIYLGSLRDKQQVVKKNELIHLAWLPKVLSTSANSHQYMAKLPVKGHSHPQQWPGQHC
jgi:hypothetical protein